MICSSGIYLNLIWAIREFDIDKFREYEEITASWKNIQSASNLDPYIGLFVILP